MDFIVRVIINAVAIWLTTLVLGNRFVVEGGESAPGTIGVYLGVALIFAIINALLKPALQLISFPFYVLTLGLFGLVINAVVLLLVEWFTSGFDWGLRLDGFWWAVLAGVFVAILNGILNGLFGVRKAPGQGIAR
ncbi:phage holin family protein [Rarobacter faecitabidus]|uniref:Putative membrane protein n=1 Tax=Rarobacter faecitabidus TaxID=13243 RepID=A0A542ZNY4_RARFA|nr:phage holin family protein [Rarobacter faecitabidus]TQL62081.1 putative membrane protein [Rarobacter faecitabidus]